MTEFKFKLRVPVIPNYISVQNDYSLVIPIEDLSDEQLIELADQWKIELLNKANSKRKNPEIKYYSNGS